jgi:hypothetical protein
VSLTGIRSLLLPEPARLGTVQSIRSPWAVISTARGLQYFPMIDGLQVGEQVLIRDGILLRVGATANVPTLEL